MISQSEIPLYLAFPSVSAVLAFQKVACARPNRNLVTKREFHLSDEGLAKEI
jgi:hypothetical protein